MSHQLLPLVCCLSKPYECRHPLDHRLVTESLAPFFPNLSPRKLKLISFFLQVRNGPAIISK